jgi:broad specificity phosphatase PhoE
MEKLRDAPLSRTGVLQVENLRKQIKRIGLPGKAQLVVTSPLTRALETTGAFDGLISCKVIGKSISILFCQKGLTERKHQSLHLWSLQFQLIAKSDECSNCANANMTVLSATPQFVYHSEQSVSELHRERLCTSCDIGRARTELEASERPWQKYDFGGIPERWWEAPGGGSSPNPDFSAAQRVATGEGGHSPTQEKGRVVQETRSEFLARVEAFRAWLRNRPESVVVVVGHSNFFKHFLGASTKMANCEVKEITL